MANGAFSRHGPLFGALLLILVGALFLYANLQPEFDAWRVLARYWPLLIIFWGLGKLLDYLALRGQSEAPVARRLSGSEVAFLILLVVLGTVVSRAVGRGTGSREVTRGDFKHSESLERQGAERVAARIKMRAGDLHLAGGVSKLLEAQFDYSVAEWKPEVSYNVSHGQGELVVEQPDLDVPHFGGKRNRWDLRVNNEVPMDLRLDLGAGKGELRLGGLALRQLDINMGAGELVVDLSGDWKNDLDANIRGGVGSLTVRLPREVGVRVDAKGGLGAIRAPGLERMGDAYVNDAYGKSKVNLRLDVKGGIGEINLEN